VTHLTNQEKLQHFYESTINDVTNTSKQMLQEYETALTTLFEEHKEEVLRKADLEIKTETEKIKRHNNKELSMEQIRMKRAISKKHSELKDKLFVEVKDLLENYMTTPDYRTLLIQQIKEAVAFAREESIIIYIDPSDSDSRIKLESAAGAKLTISQYSFMGGTRAVIPSKNVLIDNSFESKLQEAKQNFSFDGGTSHE